MSRVTVSGNTYDLAFGVDHFTGPFVQVWDQPINNQDASFLKIDDFGVSYDEEKIKQLPERTQKFVHQLKHQLKTHPGCHIGEQEVIGLARSFDDFPDIARLVYQTFD